MRASSRWIFGILFAMLLNCMAIGSMAQIIIPNTDLKELIKKADAGDSESQFILSIRYLDGIGTEKNEKLSMEYLLKAAEGGNSNAMVNAGHYHHTGKYLPKDPKAALKWYEKAAELDNEIGLYNLGIMHMVGDEVEKDETKARELFERSAAKNYFNAMFHLGRFTLFGKGGLEADSEKAFDWFMKSAQGGNVDAMDLVGTGYLVGWTKNKSDTLAAQWFLKSAQATDASAQCDMGWIYSHGRGVDKDFKQSVEWLKKSADQDFKGGQYLLGLAHYYGQGVEKDEKKGLELIEKSKVDWHFWLDDKWDYRSSSSLAWVWKDGLTVEKDMKKALDLFLLAANAGEAEAQYEAGLILAGGRGVDADLVQASMWIRICGINTPECSLDNLEQAMSAQQIAESKKLSEQWLSQHKGN